MSQLIKRLRSLSKNDIVVDPIKRKAPPPAKKKLTEDEIIRALAMTGGYVSKAAEFLRIQHSSLAARIRGSQRLQEALHYINESMLDDAEEALVDEVRNRKAWAIKFFLENKGKDRGYGDKRTKQSILNNSGVVVIPQGGTLSDWMMAAGAQGVKRVTEDVFDAEVETNAIADEAELEDEDEPEY